MTLEIGRVECRYRCGYAPKLISQVQEMNLENHERYICPKRPDGPMYGNGADGPQILAESGQTVTKVIPSDSPYKGAEIRTFDTGATRDQDSDKLEYEGFLSPLVLKRYAEYMHEHRFQSDGTLRAADNWQKGIPLDSYIGSGWRHFMDWWLLHRGHETREDIETALCALIFNASGYLHELLKKAGETRRPSSE